MMSMTPDWSRLMLDLKDTITIIQKYEDMIKTKKHALVDCVGCFFFKEDFFSLQDTLKDRLGSV